MKAIVQRVSHASVSIDGDVVGSISVGLLVLAAAHQNDTPENARKLADRVVGLRIFNDELGKMNLSLSQLTQEGSNPNAGILAISNFTIYGETAKNRRPSFVESASFELGEALFSEFVSELRARWQNVQTGVFGADMKVALVNDGPVTVIVEG